MIAYSVLYFMRLNISLALTDMGADLSLSSTQLGMISSVFFWCYAFGQLINGFLGERFQARFMVFIGLLGSGILNAVLSYSDSYLLILFCWGCNGLFQSMLWSPIVKCIAEYFEGAKKTVVSFALSITMVIGYMCAWTGSYSIGTYVDWRHVFRIPAIIGILFSIVWILLFRYSSGKPAEKQKNSFSLIRRPIILCFLGIIAVFSIVFGLIKSSIDTWLPTMITEVVNLPSSGIFITLLIIPMMNFLGILLAKFFIARLKGNIYKVILFLWVGAALLSLLTLLLFSVNSVAFVVSVMVLFGFVYGQTPLFTTFIPLDFAKWDCVSAITGFVDFAIYLGAALTGVISGRVLGDGFDWQNLCLYWSVVLFMGLVVAVFVFFFYGKLKKTVVGEEASWD